MSIIGKIKEAKEERELKAFQEKREQERKAEEFKNFWESLSPEQQKIYTLEQKSLAYDAHMASDKKWATVYAIAFVAALGFEVLTGIKVYGK